MFLSFYRFVCSVYLWKGLFCSSRTSQSLCNFFFCLNPFFVLRIIVTLLFIEVMQILLSWFSLLGFGSYEGDLCAILGLEILLAFHAFVNFPAVRSASCLLLLFECESWVSWIFQLCLSLKRCVFFIVFLFIVLIFVVVVIVRNEEVKGWCLHEFTTQTAYGVF